MSPRLIFLAAIAGLLAGCAATGQMVTVRVPVPVECREEVPARPAMPTEALRPGGSLTDAIKALMAEIELREGYEVLLLTSLKACTAPIAPGAADAR